MAKAKAKKAKKAKAKAKGKAPLLEKAILAGAKKLPGGQITGDLFRIDADGKLCGCGLGAAAVGAGMITPKELISLAKKQGVFDSAGYADEGKGISVPFTEHDILELMPVPEASVAPLEALGLEGCKINDIDVISMNDNEGDTFEGIAKAVAARRRLAEAVEKLA